MKYSLVLVVLFITINATEVENTLQQIISTEYGKNLLKNIQVSDPIDQIIKSISKIYDGLDTNLDKVIKYNKEFQLNCTTSLKEINTQLQELKHKSKDGLISIARKKPRFDLISNRLSNKKKQRLQLQLDIKRQQELRETQNALFQYNKQQLSTGETAITEVRNKFIKYISQRKNRQRKVPQLQFLEESEYDADFDEEEEERQHYEKFVFIQIEVAIEKVSNGLEMEGLTQLLQGFTDICQQLHDIKEGNIVYDDTEATLNKISQQIIDICGHIMNWIGQVKRRETEAEDAKHDISVEMLKLMRKQLQETDLEIQQLSTEVASLSQQLDQFEQSNSHAQYSFEINSDLLKAKQEACDQQVWDFKEESQALEEQISQVGTLIDLFAQKGGYLKHLLSQQDF